MIREIAFIICAQILIRLFYDNLEVTRYIPVFCLQQNNNKTQSFIMASLVSTVVDGYKSIWELRGWLF